MSTVHHEESDQSQRYAAAENLLHHSRGPRTDPQSIGKGFLVAASTDILQDSQLSPGNYESVASLSTHSQLDSSLQNDLQDRNSGCDESMDAKFTSPPGDNDTSSQQTLDSHPEGAWISGSVPQGRSHLAYSNAAPRRGYGIRQSSNLDGSETTSPSSAIDFVMRDLNGAVLNESSVASGDGGGGGPAEKEEPDHSPAWTELKTKAGKERKRLPLACIACRRKKIRCSGEKPACKHCLRSRIPCVYKVTARRAVPRTDYMAMMDKRLKRMEERVIKMIPKEELGEATAIGRANVRPPISSGNTKNTGAKKRAARDAFGPELDDWAQSKAITLPMRRSDSQDTNILTEGAGRLPSKEIQEHLAEVFFDCVYGQSYHILHKPTFMKKLRAETVPPVLILAVCAVSARFSTHPEVNSEPAFLRGEEWAAPARDIALRRYDEPSITVLTVLLILGLHEFGTCQGGRSWMLGGMAMRMAYALQLHRELDGDTLGQNNDKHSELNFIDQEIRRRTMWSCFLMDRFNSSGTQRPTCANEETIKVQLPIKESHFQMGVPGPTEDLEGFVPNPVTPETGHVSNPKENMGVAAYMIRIIAIWGRVIKYMNLGGKDRDPYPAWSPDSQFADLRRQAESFQASLPECLQNNQENLKTHATEKLGNQFLFLHIARYQVILFLHRFAIPNTPAANSLKDMPKVFVAEAWRTAIEAAGEISTLLTDAIEYSVFAPFAGYCAFMSSTVQVWGIFSKNPSLEAASKINLARNVKYLSKMKKHWGMFHFMGQNLQDIYRQSKDAALKGSHPGEPVSGGIFQYGDWFTKYPRGVSQIEYEGHSARIKEEPAEDSALGQQVESPSTKEALNEISPMVRPSSHRKVPKRPRKKAHPPSASEPLKLEYQTPVTFQAPLIVSSPPLQPSHSHATLSPTQFSPQSVQAFTPQDQTPIFFPPTYELLPQLDRRLVNGAYAGSGPVASPSTSTLDSISTNNLRLQSHPANVINPQPTTLDASIWDPSQVIHIPSFQQQPQHQPQPTAYQDNNQIPYLGMSGVPNSAWFIPFNLNLPDIAAGGNDLGGMDLGAFDAGDWFGGGM